MQTASGLQSRDSFFFFFFEGEGGNSRAISSEDVYAEVCSHARICFPKLETTFSFFNNMAKNNLLPPLLFNKGKYRLEGISKSHPGQSFSIMTGLS